MSAQRANFGTTDERFSEPKSYVAFRTFAGFDPELAAIGEMWSPWRSVASWYLWRAADEGKTVKQPG